jgi:hypothetical protein
MSRKGSFRLSVILKYISTFITVKTLITLRKAMKGAVKPNRAENIQPWASSWGIPTFVNVNKFVYYPFGQPSSEFKPWMASVNREDPTSEGVQNITSQEDVRQKTIKFIMANRTIFEELENHNL